MEHCPTCNARLKEDAVTCARCGSELSRLLHIEEQAEYWQHQAVTLMKQNEWLAAHQAIITALQLKREPLATVLLAFIERCQLQQEQARLAQARENERIRQEQDRVRLEKIENALKSLRENIR